jgi:hypothetical protein
VTTFRSLGSIRRTTTMEVSWPKGPDRYMSFDGIGRDLLTDGEGSVTVTDHVELHVDVDPVNRRVVAVWSSNNDSSRSVLGQRLGRDLRETIDRAMSYELECGAVVVQLLDDLVGAWVVSGAALTTWGFDNAGPLLRPVGGERKQIAGVCLGLAPGSSGLAADGGYGERLQAPNAVSLDVPDDPLAWHVAPYSSDMSVRRARRIDVTTGAELSIDSMFQDSSTTPMGSRAGIHEYAVTARADPVSLELTALSAVPGILPYGECPLAAHSVASLVGTRLPDLRDRVLTQLAGVRGCTHLNDAVRALASAGQLAGRSRGPR